MITWETPPTIFELPEDEVHLWGMNLQISDDLVENYSQTLSEDEILRANRFHFDYLRRRYIVARGQLRYLLGHYLGLISREICFKYSEKGKPSLDLPDLSLKIEFNLSHSEEIALFGFRKKGLIGVDVEKPRQITDVKAIAQRFFCQEEGALIEALEGKEQINAFFQLWTAKEAYLKAMGGGISAGLDKVQIKWQQGEIMGLLINDPLLSLNRSWQCISFDLKKEYIGAVVTEGKKERIRCFWVD